MASILDENFVNENSPKVIDFGIIFWEIWTIAGGGLKRTTYSLGKMMDMAEELLNSSIDGITDTVRHILKKYTKDEWVIVPVESSHSDIKVEFGGFLKHPRCNRKYDFKLYIFDCPRLRDYSMLREDRGYFGVNEWKKRRGEKEYWHG